MAAMSNQPTDSEPALAEKTEDREPTGLAPGAANAFERDAEGEASDLRKAQSALRAREEQHAFLLKLSDTLRQLNDAGDIQATTARMVGEHLRADRAIYAEVEGGRGSERGVIRAQYVNPGSEGRSPAPFPAEFTFGQFGQHTMAARYRGEPLIVADVQDDPAYSAEERSAWAQFAVRAAVIATLPKAGRLVAEFGVHSTTPREWTDAEVALIKDVAERTWAAAERARAEEALRESEEKYRTLFDTIDSGYALTDNVRDADGRVVDLFGVDFNRSYTQHSGLPPFAGRRASEVITVQPEWLRQFEEVALTGVPARHENYIAERDRWVSTHYSLVGDLGSDRVAVVFDDITDRKRAEAALRESEERHAFLLEFSDAIRAEPDADGIALFALRSLREKLQLDRCYIAEYRLDEDRGDIRYQDGNDRVPPFPDSVRLSDFPEALNVALGRTLVVDDVSTAEFLSDGDKRNMLGLGMGAFVTPAARMGENHPSFAIVAVSSAPREWTTGEIALIEEVNERTWAALERARAETALRQSEEKYAALFAASPAPFLILKPDSPRFTIAEVNDAYLAATMRTRGDLVGHGMFDVFPDNPDDPAANGVSNLRASFERALVSRRFELMDVQKYDISRPDGTFEERWWKPANAPVVDVDGKVVAIIHHVADVTTEHRAVESLQASERRAQTLLAELQHRVRNILAMIRSIARRTGETAETPEDYVQHLEGRITAMARTQAMLTSDVDAEVDLQDMVLEELVMQAAQPGQYSVSGPDVSLPGKAAEVLGLAVHELATNSTKYGALSTEKGHIDVRWALLEGDEVPQLSLVWTETGLNLTARPKRVGFGTELVTERVPYELNGTGTLDFRPTGLVATIEFPLEKVGSVLQTDEGVR